MFRPVVLAVCAMALSACQSTSPSDLKPKEYLFNAPFADTKAALTSAFADSNYRVASDEGTTLVVDRGTRAAGGGSGDDRISMAFLGDDPTKVTFSGVGAGGSDSFGGGSDTTDTAEFREAVALAASKAASAVNRAPPSPGADQGPADRGQIAQSQIGQGQIDQGEFDQGQTGAIASGSPAALGESLAQ